MNNRIKQIRASLGLSQEAFGDYLGLPKPSISRMESGQTEPTKQTLLLLIHQFGINESWLLTGEGPMTLSSASVIPPHVPPLEVEKKTRRVNLLVRPSTWEKVRQYAEDERRSCNDVVNDWIEDSLDLIFSSPRSTPLSGFHTTEDSLDNPFSFTEEEKGPSPMQQNSLDRLNLRLSNGNGDYIRKQAQNRYDWPGGSTQYINHLIEQDRKKNGF